MEQNQLAFRDCLHCGRSFTFERGPGLGPVYCVECRPVVARLLAKARQAQYRRRKRGKPNG